MDPIDRLTAAIDGQLVSAFVTVLGYGIVAAVLGLLIAIGLLIAGHRNGVFERRFRLWTILARIHFIYLPLLFVAGFGALGGVLGAHTVARRWIDATAQPVIDYAREYVPRAQAYINEALELNPGSRITAEEVVAGTMAREMAPESRGVLRAALFQLDLAIIRHFVDEALEDEDPSAVATTLRELDVSSLDAAVLGILPLSLKRVALGFFLPYYVIVFTVAVPLALIPLAEFGLHLGVGWVAGRADVGVS